jgi:hypothetical protein
LDFLTSQTITVVLKELDNQTCAPTNCEELSYLSSFAVVLNSISEWSLQLKTQQHLEVNDV